MSFTRCYMVTGAAALSSKRASRVQKAIETHKWVFPAFTNFAWYSMDTPKSSTIEVYTLSCLLQILITLSLSVPIHRLRYHTHSFDPFTARVCKITRLKDARRRLQSVHCSQYSQYIAVSTVSTLHGGACSQYIFRSGNLSTFNAMRLDENPFTCQCEKEKKRFKGFKFRTIIGRFQLTSWQWRG